MKNYKLKHLIFMALCCDLGLFAKKLILPGANLITDALHIPGGIGTSFSLLFLVVAAFGSSGRFPATIMGIVQSVIAFSFGMIGSMGALAPIGYIVPGLVIDLVRMASLRFSLSTRDGIFLASILSSVSACLTANAIVFRLHDLVLLLYASVAGTSGAVCGLLACSLSRRLNPIIGKESSHEKEKSHMDNRSGSRAYNRVPGHIAPDYTNAGAAGQSANQL